MAEFEKSIQGLPYVFDDEMMQMFHRACRLTRGYDRAGEDETERRVQILSQLLKKAGKTLYIIPISIAGTAAISPLAMMLSSTRTVC